ncbi:hypothetical protein L226DRAFT_617739, partial [Lentinus tigrinus ALCF2SS1-7]|uniref:uncharacterized protein n=1 Tax=Lentinus tigrinus ALCF2SS1-7 TaxID=1328758 RepID=UPI0011662370
RQPHSLVSASSADDWQPVYPSDGTVAVVDCGRRRCTPSQRKDLHRAHAYSLTADRGPSGNASRKPTAVLHGDT